MSSTYRTEPKQNNAATVAIGKQFTGYGKTNSGVHKGVPGDTTVKSVVYPFLLGSYKGSPGHTVKVVEKEGNQVHTATLNNFGLGIDEDNDVSHSRVAPKKYSSSEQSSP